MCTHFFLAIIKWRLVPDRIFYIAINQTYQSTFKGNGNKLFIDYVLFKSDSTFIHVINFKEASGRFFFYFLEVSEKSVMV